MPGEAWEEARRRAAVIGPLAALGAVSHHSADAAGEQLGLSRRQIYVLAERWRHGSGLVTDLAVGRSDGGKGRGRLPEAVEAVIVEVLRARYLKRQRPRLAAVYRDVERACRERGLVVPSRNTVASRIAWMDPAEVVQAREGPAAARGLRAAGGTPPAVTAGRSDPASPERTRPKPKPSTTCSPPAAEPRSRSNGCLAPSMSWVSPPQGCHTSTTLHPLP